MPFMKKGGGFFREVQLLGQSCQNRPAEFARSSLSACGLPTPVVALACIGSVDIQVLSGAGGRLYFNTVFASLYIASPMKCTF